MLTTVAVMVGQPGFFDLSDRYEAFISLEGRNTQNGLERAGMAPQSVGIRLTRAPHHAGL